jgi:hypothetical protein
MFGSHHSSLALKMILTLLEGCQEAMHPVPIAALLFDHSFDLVHSLVCSLAL